jgi:hypothetical protein
MAAPGFVSASSSSFRFSSLTPVSKYYRLAFTVPTMTLVSEDETRSRARRDCVQRTHGASLSWVEELDGVPIAGAVARVLPAAGNRCTAAGITPVRVQEDIAE